jgi:hypothetical protein
MVFASDKIHHVAQRELALSEAKPRDWILQSEIGQFPHGLLAGTWSAGHQQQLRCCCLSSSMNGLEGKWGH